MSDPLRVSDKDVHAWSERPSVFAALIALATLLAYSNSFSGPFIFDDVASIPANPTIRSLTSLPTVLSPPQADGATVGGRPLLNLSFALNYAISGTNVRSYHVVNVVIHLLAGLTLFGITRRTLASTSFAPHALFVAACTALLWTTHPVQTESVTYIVQRAESLNGLLYLSTLYAFIRAITSARPGIWLALSLVACFLGMATKEVMVTAPVIVLLYDRTFVTRTFRAALGQRAWFYAGLAATWLLLGGLMVNNQSRGDTVGFGVGVSSWEYAITQLRAIIHYLRLSFFPHPLVIDHGGLLWFSSVAPAAVAALVVFGLVACTIIALWRWPRSGFVAAWFFAILAPSSSVVPLLDSIFEHRMYLSLAAPLLALVLGVFVTTGPRAWTFIAAVTIAFGALTWKRNDVYHSDVTVWSDTIAHAPTNARAWFMLGNAQLEKGQLPIAIEHYRSAIRLRPEYVEARNNLGGALLEAGRNAEALMELEGALRLHPIAKSHFGAARALTGIGRLDEALAHYDAAVRLKPDYGEALNNRANLRLRAGQIAAALADYETALKLAPNYVEAHINAAVALIGLGRATEALVHCETALRLQPAFGAAHWKTGDVLIELNRLPAAIERYQEAVRLDPSLVHAHHNLGRALSQIGRLPEALAAYERTLQLSPDFAAARYNAGRTLEALEQWQQAITQYELALRSQPDFAEAAKRLAEVKQRVPNAPASSPRP